MTIHNPPDALRCARGTAVVRSVRAERGAATVLALGIVGVLMSVTAGAVAVAGASVSHQTAAGAADAGALAAADVASGRLPGSPCAIAEAVIRANGVRMGACEVDGLVASVSAAVHYLGFTVSAEARAGPPGSP